MPRHRHLGLGRRPKTRGHDPTRHKPGTWYEFTVRCFKCMKTLTFKSHQFRMPKNWMLTVTGDPICENHR
jgi:hypothetical protein